MTKIRKNLQQNRVVLATTQNRGRTSISPSWYKQMINK
jgi:hypothetical protein